MKVPPYLRIVLLSYAPVVLSILIMIVIRRNDLAREAIEGGLEPGFFVPLTAQEAIVSGFTIWIPGSLGVGLMATGLYYVLRGRLGLGRLPFVGITLTLSTVLAIGLFVTGNPFAPEGTFEMYACGLGYGILVPMLYSRYREEGRVLQGQAPSSR